MKKDFNFYVYIMASSTGTLYIGFTNDIRRRVTEHKNDLIDGFSKKYKCHKLVYYEHYKYVNDAITREKQLKKWSRQKKQELIKKSNSKWEDLIYNL